MSLKDRLAAITPEQWMRLAMSEPEGECEAGVAHPEAPNRFYVSHGVIHDKLTGRHIRTCDCLKPGEDGIAEACALLNDLAGPFNSKQGGIPVQPLT